MERSTRKSPPRRTARTPDPAAPFRKAPARGFVFRTGFPRRTAARDIGGRHLKLGHDRARHGEAQRNAIGAIVFMQHHRAGAGQPRLQQGQLGKATLAAHRGQIDDLGPFARPQAVGGAAAVSAHQPARAQLHAAEPAHHQHRHPVHALPFDRLQDRPARRAARLAVIVKTVFLADLVGPAVVRGLGIAVRGEEAHRLIHRGHGRGKGGEAAFLDVFLVRAGRGQRVAHSRAL